MSASTRHALMIGSAAVVSAASLCLPAAASAAPAPGTTTYLVTQCMTVFDVDFWETGQMLHGQGTMVFDVYRWADGHWVYFGENTDTIWGLENGVTVRGPMHGDVVLFHSTIGDFTGTWSAGTPSEGLSGAGQIMARSTDGTMKLQTPKSGEMFDPPEYPGNCGSVGEWVVTTR